MAAWRSGRDPEDWMKALITPEVREVRMIVRITEDSMHRKVYCRIMSYGKRSSEPLVVEEQGRYRKEEGL